MCYISVPPTLPSVDTAKSISYIQSFMDAAWFSYFSGSSTVKINSPFIYTTNKTPISWLLFWKQPSVTTTHNLLYVNLSKKKNWKCWRKFWEQSLKGRRTLREINEDGASSMLNGVFTSSSSLAASKVNSAKAKRTCWNVNTPVTQLVHCCPQSLSSNRVLILTSPPGLRSCWFAVIVMRRLQQPVVNEMK